MRIYDFVYYTGIGRKVLEHLPSWSPDYLLNYNLKYSKLLRTVSYNISYVNVNEQINEMNEIK